MIDDLRLTRGAASRESVLQLFTGMMNDKNLSKSSVCDILVFFSFIQYSADIYIDRKFDNGCRPYSSRHDRISDTFEDCDDDDDECN